VPGQNREAEHDPAQIAGQRADDQPPDRTPHPAGRHGDEQGKHLATEIDDREPAQEDLAVERVHAGGREPADHEPEPGHRHERPQRWRRVVPRRRPAHDQAEPEEDEAPDDLDRPGGVEQLLIVASLALDDRRPDAHIGEQLEPRDEDRRQRHQAERAWVEDPGEDQVTAKAEDVLGPVPDDRPAGAREKPLLERSWLLHDRGIQRDAHVRGVNTGWSIAVRPRILRRRRQNLKGSPTRSPRFRRCRPTTDRRPPRPLCSRRLQVSPGCRVAARLG